MFIFLIVLIIIVAILLIGVVLIQKSKGGGLASSFAGANQVMGVRHTNTFIERFTWWLIGIMWLLCVLATYAMPRSESADTVNIRVQDAPVNTVPGGNYDSNLPAAPVAEPAAE